MMVTDQRRKPVPVINPGALNGQEIDLPESFEEKFHRSKMDQRKDYPLPVPVVRLNQNGEVIDVCTKKSYSLVQGKQKSKKSTLVAKMVAGFISETSSFDNIFFSGHTNGVALFFDNEQGESYAARTMKLILKIAGLEYSSRLEYCDLREFSPSERVKVIEAGIRCTPNVSLVIIDGVVDLMEDFMDAHEGHLTITNIIKLCSEFDIHVTGVLHQNKGDKNARAHVGTISSQKCEIEISTEVDPDDRSQSIVTCVNSRGLPFEPFAIRWDKGSLPTINQDWNKGTSADAKAVKNKSQVEEIAQAVFKPLTALRQTEAIESLMNITMKSESTAKRHLKDLLIWKIVVKSADGLYRINTEKT